jgi:hypothetical protein
MNFLGLITRCKDEFFIKEFTDYYLSQGVDKIFIIDDNSDDKSIYNKINDNRTDIIYENDIINTNYVSKLYNEIRSEFKWIIYCDVDEFITTKRNIKKTIRDELETTFKDVDCIIIPWVFMASGNKEKNPDNILLENYDRWNHNKKHFHSIHKFRCRYNKIEVKCIFKTNKFNNISDHIPLKPINNPIISNSITGENEDILSCFYTNLREENIKNGILLCYHYRIISKENCINKLNTNNWYIENGYTLNDLLKSDYNELIDETLRYKTHCTLIKKYFEKYFINIEHKSYFLGLITRCKDEYHIEEFCNYYLNQGVQKIIILDDKSNNIHIYDKLINNDKIIIYFAKHNSKCHDGNCNTTCTCNRVLVNEIYNSIKTYFEWIIYCDVDEFITTRKNIKKTIRDELETTYSKIDCISIPWIMMSSVNNKNPKSVLETNIYRMNYNNKPMYKCNTKNGNGKFSVQSSGKQIQCKSIFKCDKFDGIHDITNANDHHPCFPKTKYINWVESVNNSKVKLNYINYHKNLNELDIQKSYLLCYHYRIISEEHAILKMNTNDWYIENGYTLKNMIRKDRDVEDNTLRNKSIYMEKINLDQS